MKGKRTTLPLAALALLVALASGCAGTTPIGKLALPPVTVIEGVVTQPGEGGFTLTDDSGSIFVRARLPGSVTAGLAAGERVTVYGNLQAGPERIFDGYVIRRPSGEQIVVTRPTPHFGFVIQGPFP
ncbi:MAG: hypothetical protein LT103_04580 [Burkholderiaceae bacterium]|nr:hypothetical protein [Burkholderiaceae bacterium]